MAIKTVKNQNEQCPNINVQNVCQKYFKSVFGHELKLYTNRQRNVDFIINIYLKM